MIEFRRKPSNSWDHPDKHLFIWPLGVYNNLLLSFKELVRGIIAKTRLVCAEKQVDCSWTYQFERLNTNHILSLKSYILKIWRRIHLLRSLMDLFYLIPYQVPHKCKISLLNLLCQISQVLTPERPKKFVYRLDERSWLVLIEFLRAIRQSLSPYFSWGPFPKMSIVQVNPFEI